MRAVYAALLRRLRSRSASLRGIHRSVALDDGVELGGVEVVIGVALPEDFESGTTIGPLAGVLSDSGSRRGGVSGDGAKLAHEVRRQYAIAANDDRNFMLHLLRRNGDRLD